jgi:hypothetical protein
LIAHRVDAKGNEMARYKPIVREGVFLPVVLAEQIQAGHLAIRARPPGRP